MKRNRLIFYAVFGVFHLFLVIFTFYIESNKNDFVFLTQMLKWVSWMKFGAILGFLLLITDVLWSFVMNRENKKEKAALTHEVNTLKAKLFDLQEAARPSAPQQPTSTNLKS